MHQLRRYGLESATTNFHTVKKAVRELSAGLEAVNPKLNLSEKPVV